MSTKPDPDFDPKVEPPKENLLKPSDLKPDPLRNLPDFVKHPKNFETIQKALLETLACGKTHSDPLKMLDCGKCRDNMVKRRKLMEKFGFKEPAMYMEWRKRHEELKKRVPLEMYNKLVEDDEKGKSFKV